MNVQEISAELTGWKPVQEGGKPTPLGQALLDLPDAELHPLVGATCKQHPGRFYGGDRGLIELFTAHAPGRVRPLFDSPELAYALGYPAVVGWLMKLDPGHFAGRILARSDDAKIADEVRLLVKVELAKADPATFTAPALAGIREIGVNRASRANVLSWLSRDAGPEGIPVLAELMTAKSDAHWWNERTYIIDAVRRFKQDALPVVRAALAHAQDGNRPFLIRQLMDLGDPADEPLITHVLGEMLLRLKDGELADYVALAGAWKPERVADQLWPLLEHASKPVRRKAAEVLGTLGAPALERGKVMLVAKKPDHRATGVDLLGAAGGPEATAALEARVDVEENDDVRDSILKRLAPAWRAAGRSFSRADLDARVAKPVKLLPALRDVQYSSMPPLYFTDGEQLTPDHVRWLIGRGGRPGDELDIEATLALPLIDRKRAGDFALALLGTTHPVWMFKLAALLGDDRAVHAMHSQIRQLADGTGHKTAEGAVGHLALNGSDMALLAVDALSRRYASKKKHVGEAAGRAFAAAAARLGVSVDELGDRVVPSLGFEPGRPRLVKAEGKEFEARVGMDWKLHYVDTAKRKPVASLPKSVGADVLKEFKEVAASLREVSKAQVARLENLLVRQQRWRADKWQELYTRHPLLVPFAVRLVWGEYGPDGSLRQTFRALEDGTLTGPEDTVTLPADGRVGLVHPLELSDAVKAAWLEHLEDYKVIPPFAQLERPVIRVPSERAKEVFNRDHAGHEMNAMTLRGRLERWGWGHAARGDHGHLCAFAKRFGTAGVDAVVRLEDGIMAGAGPEDSATLAQFFFVRAGTLDPSRYNFEDAPRSTDERLVPLGEVPPVAYSETAGDLQRLVTT